MAPSDFALFPKLKLKLKGRRFDTLERIQEASLAVINTLEEQDFQKTFDQWQKRWDRCVRADGNYFEGDGDH